MRSDAQIFVTCDLCGDEEVWEPTFSYTDYSGKNGSYETSDTAFRIWCAQNKWAQDGDKDYCPDCVEAGRNN